MPSRATTVMTLVASTMLPCLTPSHLSHVPSLQLEVQVQQLQGLKECLEEQLDAALYEKEQIEEELQQVGSGCDAVMGGRCGAGLEES